MKVEYWGDLSILCYSTGCSNQAAHTVRLRLSYSLLKINHLCSECKDEALRLSNKPVCLRCEDPACKNGDNRSECRYEWGG